MLQVPEDSIATFTDDVVKSSKRPLNDLVTTLTAEATDGLNFLRDRVRFNLSFVGQLGGHSHPRTHRPAEGLVGQEIILALQRIVKTLAPGKSKGKGSVQLILKGRVKRIQMGSQEDAQQRVVGVEYESRAKGADLGKTNVLRTSFVLLATGGYANDHTEDSLLESYRPELAKVPTTNNKYSTGDGVKLARAVGAHLTDMDQVRPP